MKTCKDCKQTKPLEDFAKASRGYLRSYCKPCFNKRQKAYRDGDGKEKVQASWRNASKKYQSNPKVQHQRRLRKHNLTDKEYNDLFDSQHGKCKICGKSITLVIDHCHKTNVVRGLLCNGCNLILGYAEDNLDTLRAAVVYLEIHCADRAMVGSAAS